MTDHRPEIIYTDTTPKNLMKVRVEWQEKLAECVDRINGGYNAMYHVDLNDGVISKLEEAIKNADGNTLNREWYKGQGPSYWCGIFVAYPWEDWIDKEPFYGEESYLWVYFLKNHVEFKDGFMCFKYNEKSILNKWLHRMTGEPEVTSGVRRLFLHAIKVVLKDWPFEIVEEEFEEDEEKEMQNG
jgi:hypothetical protein